MAAEEEGDALLFLIQRHLEVNGFNKAAKLLAKHVNNTADTAEMSFNLHDIYTGWMKLCSKQETNNSANGAEPVTIEDEQEEVVNGKLSNNGEEDHVEAKPPPGSKGESNGVESSSVSNGVHAVTEPLLESANLVVSEEEEAETQVEEEDKSTPAEASAVNGAETSSSSDTAELTTQHEENDVMMDESAQSTPVEVPTVNGAETSSDPAEAAELTTVDPEPVTSAEPDAVVHEPEKEPEAVMDATDDDEATPPCTQEAGEEGAAAEMSSPAEPAGSDLTSKETNEQLAETEAPPPADEVTEVTAEEQTDPDDCIIINIQDQDGDAAKGEVSQLPSVEDQDVKTPKKKKNKKKRKDTETSATDTDTPTTETSLVDTPITSTSDKKKKRNKKRKEVDEEDQGEEEQVLEKEEEEVAIVSPVTPSKKKAKKRKRERDAVEEEEEKEEETAEVVEEKEVDNAVSPAEATTKKKKKKKSTTDSGQEQPAEGDKGLEKEPDTTDVNSSQLSSGKKRHRVKLSLKKRLRLHKKEKLMKTTGEKTQIQEAVEETPRPKSNKRPKPELSQDQDTPKKKKKRCAEQEENSSKENQPPLTKPKKNKKKKKSLDESGVVADLTDELLDASFTSSEPEEKKKRKKKNKKQKVDGGEETTGKVTPAKKNKKNKPTPTAPAASTKKKTSKKKAISG